MKVHYALVSCLLLSACQVVQPGAGLPPGAGPLASGSTLPSARPSPGPASPTPALPSSAPGQTGATPAPGATTPTASTPPLPAGLSAIRISLGTPYLSARGQTTSLSVTGLDVAGQPLIAPLPLSFALSRPQDFSISPDGLITALTDQGYSDVIVKVNGTDIEARTSLSVSAATFSGGSSGGGSGSAVNLAPSLSLSASATSVGGTGDLVRLEGTGIDPEGKTLSCTWSCKQAACGSFSSTSTGLTYWRSPAASGTYTLVLTASDGSKTTSLSQPIVVSTGTDSATLQTGSRVWYVNAAVSGGTGSGTSWANAFSDLQDALAAAATGEEIRIAEGTYYPGSDREDVFEIPAGVTVYGGFDALAPVSDPDDRDLESDVTVLSGDIGTPGDSADNSQRIVLGHDGIRLDGLTISDAFADTGQGAGLYAENSSLTLTNVGFSHNTASAEGGGLYLIDGELTGTGLSFDQNKGSEGGGIFLQGSTVDLSELSLTSNQAQRGAGMSLRSGVTAVSDATISANSASSPSFGGGVQISSAAGLSVTRTTFSDNQASSGAGIYNRGTLTVSDSVFSGNQGNRGGGLSNNASATVSNTVFYNNYASNCGGALAVLNGMELIDSTLYHNQSNSGGGICGGRGMRTANVLFYDSNLVDLSVLPAYIGSDADQNQFYADGVVIVGDTVDPFTDSSQPEGDDGVWMTADDGLRLKADSLLIDQGKSVVSGLSLPLYDLLGLARPAGTAPDPGAYEGGYVQP